MFLAYSCTRAYIWLLVNLKKQIKEYNECINNKSNSFHCRGYEHLYNKS